MHLSVVASENSVAEERNTADPTVVTNLRLASAKAAYTTRFLARMITASNRSFRLVTGEDAVPRAGDVVLARVDRVGQHKGLESPGGRRTTIFPGDEVLVAYGHRYAPDQFEAVVPSDLGPMHLVAAGGVASRVVTAHNVMAPATTLLPIGLLADEDGVVTLERCAPFGIKDLPAQDPSMAPSRPLTIAVVGTAMNAGKSTTAAAIVRGLTACGMRVAAGKVTGTGAPGDPGMFVDSGAVRVLDFTDFGFASTYLMDAEHVASLFSGLVAELHRTAPDAVVLEVADGLLQAETAALVSSPLFSDSVDRVVFAAADALGAVAGESILGEWGLEVAAAGGMLTASPLATREAMAAVKAPVVSNLQFASPDVLHHLAVPTHGATVGTRAHVAS